MYFKTHYFSFRWWCIRIMEKVSEANVTQRPQTKQKAHKLFEALAK
jgi:hypothetical protein